MAKNTPNIRICNCRLEVKRKPHDQQFGQLKEEVKQLKEQVKVLSKKKNELKEVISAFSMEKMQSSCNDPNCFKSDKNQHLREFETQKIPCKILEVCLLIKRKKCINQRNCLRENTASGRILCLP
ncbi:unnamed protein product [Moneuplotes crassus]|uniref:Uncharacterized protein n=1 Tax=Euplotes crassus TaxID=5936 RepID=A0AAD1Y594_EUPCR|nr:unnamed protein product [Moneuplotes crassus]